MSRYWTIAEKDAEGSSRPFYVVAPTEEEAISKVEALAGHMPRSYIDVKEIRAEDVPEGEDPL